MEPSLFRKLYSSLFGCLLICAFPYLASGQFGPFGIGNATGADGQPKLLVWLDGSTPTNAVNTDVLNWPDKSGYGNDFTGVGATSPILRSGGPQGRPYLEFMKANNRLNLDNLTFTENGVSIFFMIRTNDTDHGIFSFAESDANPRQILIHEAAGTRRFTVQGNEFIPGSDHSSNNWLYVGYTWDNNSDPTYWHRAVTGGPETVDNAVLTSSSSEASGNAVIGHIKNQLADGGFIGSNALIGDIAEIVIYDGKVNKAMLRMINTYFRNKYDIGGTGVFDKLLAPPTHREDPIGIGRDGGSASEHLHSRAGGLVLRANSGGLNGSFAYLSGAHEGNNNTVVATDLPAGVQERWARNYYIRKDGLGGSSDVQIAFDLQAGINGDFPFNADNYVLLSRSSLSGPYDVTAVTEKSINGIEVVFRLSGAQVLSPRYYTLGTTNALISPVDGQLIKTWYAYQSGNWNDPDTWTQDGSAAPNYINVNADIPGPADAVVIASGRSVLMNVNNVLLSSLSLQGNLDIAATGGHNFTTISGNGLIRCSGFGGMGNFPLGNTTNFADAFTGGNVEFYGSGFTQNEELLVNRLTINLSNAINTIVLRHRLTHNGTFEITRGTIEVNIPVLANRVITSNGNVEVEANGRIIPKASGAVEEYNWNFEQDFSNNGGSVRFTNRATPAVAAYYVNNESLPYITARFLNPSQNQRVVADGITVFSRMVVDKGSDATYALTLSALNSTRFFLLGRCNLDMPNSDLVSEASNGNSCSIVNGTLEVQENVFIPLHASGGNYNLNRTALLWINGGSAAKGAPHVLGGANGTAIVVYGGLKVSEGQLHANCQSGITLRANGLIEVEGVGELFTNQIRTSLFGPTNIGGFVQRGGMVLVDGTRPGGAAGDYYTFCMTYPGNLFQMSGGTLQVAGPTDDGLIFINSDESQVSVTGGTILAVVKNTSDNHRISTRAPFWNLTIRRTVTGTNRPIRISGGTTFGSETVPDLPLTVKKTLNIEGTNSPTLRMRTAANIDLNLHLEGDLTVANGGVYDHFLNTTYFDGNSSSLVSLPTAAAETFHNLVIDKETDIQSIRLIAGNSIMAMEVQGKFSLLKGNVDNLSRSVRMLGDVQINSVFGTPTATGRAELAGTALQNITSSGGVFHRLTLNNANGVRLENSGLTVRNQFTLTAGIFNIQNHKLRIETADGALNISAPSALKCILTNGAASSGGLELIFKSAAQTTIFPLAVPNGLGVKYTPAEIRINSGYVDDGYIQVVPVDALLETVDLNAGGDFLDFHWKVRHSDFIAVPNVSHRFTYIATDFTGINVAAGRVLTDLPFSRQTDFLSIPSDHVVLGAENIYYNDGLSGTVMNGAGAPIVNADYTAGFADRFIGSPKVYYSRSATYDAQWDSAANWNEASSFLPGSGPYLWHGMAVPAATDYPKAGDLAFIGFDPTNGRPHVFAAQTNGTAVAKISFTPLQTTTGTRLPRFNGSAAADITVRRPTLSISTQSQITNIREITGEGTLLLREPVNIQTVDVAGFLIEDSSIVMIQANSLFDITLLPSNLPNVYITTSGNGSNNFSTVIRPNITVRSNLEIVGNANLLLNSGSTGNITVGNNLILARYQAVSSGPQLLYDGLSPVRQLNVAGDLRLIGSSAQIGIIGPDSPQAIHRLSVGKNIVQSGSSSSMTFYTNATSDYIALELSGSGNHSYVKTSGTDPVFGSIILDKGISNSSSFTFNSNFTLGLPANQAVKPLQLRNGKMVVNNSAINLTLSSGGGSFEIPSTTGLELQAGNLRINGSQTGLILDGLLQISGGLMEIGNTLNENNFLECGASGTATINLSGGELLVGSQLRRGLTNTSGVLKYTQTGGLCRVGIYSAPATNRGVFEVLNPSSVFNFTAGEIQLVRGINSSSLASLRLDPTVSNTLGTGVITIGAVSSPAGGQIQNVGIQSSVTFNELRIDNSSGNNPTARLYVLPLKISGLLYIDAGGSLNCGIQDLVIQGDIQNDGLLTASTSLLTLDHAAAKSINGSGVFNLSNLERIGNAITNVNTNLTVNQNFDFVANGIMNFGVNKLTVLRNVNVNGTLQFTDLSEGLVMGGNIAQTLRRSGSGSTSIDVLTIKNPAGVQMITGAGYIFSLSRRLRMQQGVFDLKGNLLDLGAAAQIIPVSAFGITNMINTSGAFTDFGVKKTFAQGTNTDFLVPLGLDKYMPINLIFSGVGGSSGSTLSSYQFKLNIPRHPVIINDLDAPEAEINDLVNVLQMYFTLEAANVGNNLKMNAEFFYDQSYVAVAAPLTEADYIGARVVDGSPSPSIFKFPTGVVNSINNILTFTFDGATAEGINGDYFAGVDWAIPELVPVYTTTRIGLVVEGAFPAGVYDSQVPGLGAPNGAVVIVEGSDVLTLNINGINLYKTIIDENATLVIPNTSQHRLGIVEGSGTIRLEGSGNLPAGNYNAFFTCAGGKLEYAGGGIYDVLANIPTIRKVTLSGAGTRLMSNNDVTICEDLVLIGPAFTNFPGVKITVQGDFFQNGTGIFNVNTGELTVEGDAVIINGQNTSGTGGIRTFENDLTVSAGIYNVSTGRTNLKGNLTFNSGSFLGGSNVGRFTFNGNLGQTLNGNFQIPNGFHRLEINNPFGLILDGQVDISNQLLLTNGNIYTSIANTLHISTFSLTTVVPPGGSPSSYVDGPMDWTLPATSSIAVFPIGKDIRWRPLRISNRSVARRWTAEHFNFSAAEPPYNFNMIPAIPDEDLIETISVQEFWSLNSNTSDPTTAVVGLSWGPNSVVSPIPADYNALLTLIYEGGAWVNKGGANFSYNSITETGFLLGTAASSFTEKFFTLGSSLGVNPLPVTWLHFNGETADNVNVLNWATSTEENNSHFILERSADAQNWQEIARLNGAGYSTQALEYQYRDFDAPYGRSYYRLRQVDFDTKFEYAPNVVSLERVLDAEPGRFEFILFPNPNHIGEARLIASDMKGSNVRMVISNLMGQIVENGILSIDDQGMSATFDCNFQSGVYVVTLYAGNRVGSKKLVVSK